MLVSGSVCVLLSMWLKCVARLKKFTRWCVLTSTGNVVLSVTIRVPGQCPCSTVSLMFGLSLRLRTCIGVCPMHLRSLVRCVVILCRNSVVLVQSCVVCLKRWCMSGALTGSTGWSSLCVIC